MEFINDIHQVITYRTDTYKIDFILNTVAQLCKVSDYYLSEYRSSPVYILHRGTNGLPSIKLAVYSNIQIKEGQLSVNRIQLL